jgi:DNA/RNA endonuclease YhcR with UshA esterase domain
MMKVAWIASLTALVAAPAWAAVISATAASSHVGQSVTVEGLVSEVHTARSGKETFIDIGGAYPNQTFTAVIFERSAAVVGDVSGLTGKTVDITGTIQMYEGKPEVIITSRDQIRAKMN